MSFNGATVQPIDAAPDDLAFVLSILDRHVPELEVRAFGSRARWNARETSDLDLALMTRQPLAAQRLAALREAFSESDLPFKVDLVDWAATPERFRRMIEHESVVLRPGPRSRGAARQDVRPGLSPTEQRRATAAVLQALDDRIELNRRMSVTLTALSRALAPVPSADVRPSALRGHEPMRQAVVRLLRQSRLAEAAQTRSLVAVRDALLRRDMVPAPNVARGQTQTREE